LVNAWLSRSSVSSWTLAFDVLGGSSVEAVPLALALDAAGRGGLVPEPLRRDAPAAAFADPVGARSQALQRALDLLAILV
jgi:hypothetical protein